MQLCSLSGEEHKCSSSISQAFSKSKDNLVPLFNGSDLAKILTPLPLILLAVLRALLAAVYIVSTGISFMERGSVA